MRLTSLAGRLHLHHRPAPTGLYVDGLLVHATDEFMTVDKVLELAVEFDPRMWLVFDPPPNRGQRHAWAPAMADRVWVHAHETPTEAARQALTDRLFALADKQDQPAVGHVSLLHVADLTRLGPVARLVVLNETGLSHPEGLATREGLMVLAAGVPATGPRVAGTPGGFSVEAAGLGNASPFDGPLGMGVRLAQEQSWTERRGLRRRTVGVSSLTYVWLHEATHTAVRLHVHVDTLGAMAEYEKDSDALARSLTPRDIPQDGTKPAIEPAVTPEVNP